MSFKKIDVSEIQGFRLGNSEDKVRGTGCTVIICEDGAVGGVDVRGGAPATRETDLLRSENTVESVHAVVLSGGSAFGLEAASGVMRELAKRGIGFKMCGISVPIVCGASLFDLSLGSPDAFPDVKMGAEAARNAYRGGTFKNGNNGAGTGASVGKTLGMKRAMKTGLGTYACGDGFVQVGAVVAVNALGDVYSGGGKIIAGLRTRDGASISGTINELKDMVCGGVPEEQASPDTGRSKSPSMPPDDRARSSFSAAPAAPRDTEPKKPVHQKIPSQYTGIVRAMEAELKKTTGIQVKETEARAEASAPNRYGRARRADTPAVPSTEDKYLSMYSGGGSRADSPQEPQIRRADTAPAYAAAPDPYPAAAASADRYRVSDPTPEREINDGDPELGYDIPFNTTIGCLITNAKLTKSQANKLASTLHDAYARAIKPVHSSQDGDTIFVLSTGKETVDFDAFAALATDVMQYAIIDGALSAKGAYGLPSAGDI